MNLILFKKIKKKCYSINGNPLHFPHIGPMNTKPPVTKESLCINGISYASVTEAANAFGITRSTLRRRLRTGYVFETLNTKTDSKNNQKKKQSKIQNNVLVHKIHEVNLY